MFADLLEINMEPNYWGILWRWKNQADGPPNRWRPFFLPDVFDSPFLSMNRNRAVEMRRKHENTNVEMRIVKFVLAPLLLGKKR